MTVVFVDFEPEHLGVMSFQIHDFGIGSTIWFLQQSLGEQQNHVVLVYWRVTSMYTGDSSVLGHITRRISV